MSGSARVDECLKQTVHSCKQLDERQQSQHINAIITIIKCLFDNWQLIPKPFLVPINLIHFNPPSPNNNDLLPERFPQPFQLFWMFQTALVICISHSYRFDLVQYIIILLYNFLKVFIDLILLFLFDWFWGIINLFIFQIVLWVFNGKANLRIFVWIHYLLCLVFILFLSSLIGEQPFLWCLDVY